MNSGCSQTFGGKSEYASLEEQASRLATSWSQPGLSHHMRTPTSLPPPVVTKTEQAKEGLKKVYRHTSYLHKKLLKILRIFTDF